MNKPSYRVNPLYQPLSHVRRHAKAALVCGALLSSMSVMSPVFAQTDTHSYQLEAGNLSQVLNRFAAESGVVIYFDAAITRGKRAAGLDGDYSVEAGLQKILIGSGLRAVLKEDGSYQIEIAQTTGPVDLSAISVDADTVQLGSNTDRTGSYTTGSTSSALKIDLSMRETPQTVSVVTRQQIEDQGLDTVEDVLLSSPGITITKAGSSRPTFYSRGFTITDISYDGMPTSINNYAFALVDAMDTAIYDHVEIVRGATGMMQGTGNPSAHINLVRKKPTKDFQGYVQLQAGSWNNQRAEVDVSGSLIDSGTVRGRFVSVYEDKDSFMDNIYGRKQINYGILDIDLTDKTLLSVSANLQKTDRGISWSMQPYGLKRSSNLSPDWSYNDSDNEYYSAELTHHFDSGWKVKVAANYIESEQKFVGTYYGAGELDLATGDGLSLYNGSEYYNEDRQVNFDAYASGPFSLLGREHELVIGADHRWREFEPWGGYGSGTIPFNVYTSDTSSLIPKPYFSELSEGTWDYSDKQTSTYATVRWSVADPLTVITGARITDWEYEQASSGNKYEVKDEVTPYVGVIYDLDDIYSVYASYTSIFEPQNAYDSSGSLLDPIEGKSYEVGIKGEFYDGRLNSTLALYRTDQENRANDDFDGPSPCPYSTSTYCSRASGEVRSQGVEFELSGEIAKGTQLGFGYTYNRAYYLKDENNEGDSFNTRIPKHILRANLSHELNADWTVGGSLVTQSRIYNTDSNDVEVAQGGYYVMNLMANWQMDKHFSVRVNLNNLFDREYYQVLGTAKNLNEYGAPRNVLVTGRYTF